MFEESVSLIPSIWASMNSWFTPTVLFLFLNLMIGTIAITSSLATKKGNNDQQKQQQQQQEHYGHNHNNHHEPQLPRSPSMLQRLKSINFYNYRSHEPNTNFAQTPSVGNSHFTSHFSHEHEHEHDQEHEQQQQEEPQLQFQHQPTRQLGRSPSMLQRLKSFNLYNYLSQDSADAHYSSNQEQEREREQEHHLEPEDDEEEEEEEEGAKGEEEDRFEYQEPSLLDIYNQLKKGNNVARTKSDTKPASGEILKKMPKKMKKSASSKSAFNHFKEEDIVEVEARRPATMKEYGNPKVTQADDEGVDAKADDFIHKFKQQLKLQRTNSIIRYREMINRGAGK